MQAQKGTDWTYPLEKASVTLPWQLPFLTKKRTNLNETLPYIYIYIYISIYYIYIYIYVVWSWVVLKGLRTRGPDLLAALGSYGIPVFHQIFNQPCVCQNGSQQLPKLPKGCPQSSWQAYKKVNALIFSRPWDTGILIINSGSKFHQKLPQTLRETVGYHPKSDFVFQGILNLNMFIKN